MNKKFTTLLIACFALLTTANAQYNLFDAKDVDADGWLWFDTQEKIDKYVGLANNEDYKLDPNGKIIQLACADFGDYEDSAADPTVIGAGTDGNLGGTDAKTGAIILASAAAQSSTNGGAIIVRMPSTCTSFNLYFSSEARILGRLLGSTDETLSFTDYTPITVKCLPGFSQIGNAGQKSWLNLEKGDNGYEPPFSLTSSSKMCAKMENCQKYPLYIHGIKVLVSEPTTGIANAQADSSLKFDGKTITADEATEIDVYSTTGNLMASEYTSSMNLSNLAKGIYVVKAEQKTMKIAIR